MLSIIIPVYNAEQFLCRCLDSIVIQLNDMVEVVLVDDGSTDESLRILRKYQEEFEQVMVYSKPNEGVGSARNFGIQVSNGEYIAFVDSDDFVTSDYVAIMMSATDEIRNKKCDLCIFGYYHITGYNQTEKILPHSAGSFKENLRAVYQQKHNAPWNKLWSRSVIEKHSLRFPVTMRTSEDSYFLHNYTSYIKEIGFFDVPIYYYCDNSCGAVSNVKWQYLIDTVKMSNKATELSKTMKMSFDNEIQNSTIERLWIIVLRYLEQGKDLKLLNKTICLLSTDLDTMNKLTTQNKLKRDLISHQLFAVIRLIHKYNRCD